MLETLINKTNGGGVNELPDTPGSIYQGGYYVGEINVGDKRYALVVSPKASGESFKKIMSDNYNPNPAPSLDDGLSNTMRMLMVNAYLYPAALFCRSLVIGGHDDWYLPSVNELEMCYRNLKPTTGTNAVLATGPYRANGSNHSSSPVGAPYTTSIPQQTNIDIFKMGGPEAFSDGLYWSSTQSGGNDWFFQQFSDGIQSTYTKLGNFAVRAVRRVLIS